MTQPAHLRGCQLRRDGVAVDGDQAWALFCACADGDLQACRNDSRDAIRMLLAYGADANGQYDSGGCCLSIYSGSDRIFQLLREHGAVDYPYMMDTAQMRQAVRDNLPVARYLGHHNWGDFHMSVVGRGDLKLLDLYAEKVGTERLSTLAWRYAYATDSAFIARLVELGANPNNTDWRGRTVLHWCADKNDAATAVIYLRHGADVNAVDVLDNTTPLGYAARRGHLDMVKLLLAHGADPSLPGDCDWTTPLAYAELEGREEVAAVLSGAC